VARTILHVDMDAFYVSVELRRRPELRGRPVVVGGAGRRGVVAAASYEARRFGVHSAMPSATARRLCPDAVFLPGDHELYGEVSAEVHRCFHEVTPLVEPIALDEAFLDVTGASRLLGDGVEIGGALRSRIDDQLQLPCSVGVAPNKLLAKLASEAAKPRSGPAGITPGRGVVEVRPGEETAFLHPLPVQALWGVGPATLRRLANLGVRTVGDLASVDERVLVTALGAGNGRHLHLLANAVDDRPVEPDRALKSIGHEETFAHDKHTVGELDRELVRLADAVAGRLRAHGGGARTVTLKVRFSSFETITRSSTSAAPVDTAAAIGATARELLRGLDPGQGVRLIGISVSHFGPVAEQLSLDIHAGTDTPAAPEPGDWRAAEETMDAIRQRFGTGAIGPASTVDPRRNGLRVVRRGAQQWGPDQ
jgi:DNA polymerase-4